MKGSGVNAENVKVVVRCRPMNMSERMAGSVDIVRTQSNKKSIGIEHSRENLSLGRSGKKKQFTFDEVYDTETTQNDLYEKSVRPMVNHMFEGYNVTIFTYGQTGTGKTFTMEGNNRQQGIMQNSFKQIFDFVESTRTYSCIVECSYLEIYQGKIRDLLNSSASLDGVSKTALPSKLLRSIVCESEEDLENCRRMGYMSRMTASTYLNEYSSRSHAIFTVNLSLVNKKSKKVKIRTKLNFVDLAGSESLQRSYATNTRLKECCEINLSLLAVNKVISSSISGKTYIPYRDSLLTLLLQDSFGGKSTKTLMIANICPTAVNYKETLTTLEYARKAKKIKNEPISKFQNTKKDQETLVELTLWRDRLAKAQQRNQLLESTIKNLMKNSVQTMLNAKGVDVTDLQTFYEDLKEKFDFPLMNEEMAD